MDEVADYLREAFPEAAELALWTRDAVLAAEPELSQRVYRGWRGVGLRHESAGYVCGIFPQPDDSVRLLFEHGAELPDPDGVLRGDGRQTRWLAVAAPGGAAPAPDDATAARIRALVHEAIARRLR